MEAAKTLHLRETRTAYPTTVASKTAPAPVVVSTNYATTRTKNQLLFGYPEVDPV